MMDELPYAIMRELEELAGSNPSTDLKVIGIRRPSPEALQRRRPHLRPISPRMFSREVPTKPESQYEFSASTQDLVDFGLIEHGFWHDGDRQTTHYGFHLTEKAMNYLRPQPLQSQSVNQPPSDAH